MFYYIHSSSLHEKKNITSFSSDLLYLDSVDVKSTDLLIMYFRSFFINLVVRICMTFPIVVSFSKYEFLLKTDVVILSNNFSFSIFRSFFLQLSYYLFSSSNNFDSSIKFLFFNSVLYFLLQDTLCVVNIELSVKVSSHKSPLKYYTLFDKTFFSCLLMCC